jgi:ubiquinone/menaquinone biosynthesis C-methylase UbiE
VSEKPELADHCSAQYGQFSAQVHARVRRVAFGEDIGQNSWLTVAEPERFSSSLQLGNSSRLLDVACGSGGPALHLARETGCDVTGVELYDEAVEAANQLTAGTGLEARVRFVRADASRPLQFEDDAFDAVLCVDAINHLPGRGAVLPTGPGC